MQFSLDTAPDLPPAFGDLTRVRQIIVNLVNNAYNYTKINGKILVSLHCQDDQVQIDVCDNGIGIAPAEQDRIFDRFYRGDDPLVLATPGTGLGLSIVRQLVLMHQGRFWLQSSGVDGEGSTFSFTLPIYQPEKIIDSRL
jgi:signal transduction histidine kinase